MLYPHKQVASPSVDAKVPTQSDVCRKKFPLCETEPTPWLTVNCGFDFRDEVMGEMPSVSVRQLRDRLKQPPGPWLPVSWRNSRQKAPVAHPHLYGAKWSVGRSGSGSG